eukprot:3236384-Prorocentrum_lima.AAC.1
MTYKSRALISEKSLKTRRMQRSVLGTGKATSLQVEKEARRAEEPLQGFLKSATSRKGRETPSSRKHPGL